MSARRLTAKQIAAVLEKHRAWWYAETGGVRADLRGANLSGADLSGADLIGADLSGADLSGANLIGADLSSADLSGANLIGADLSGADLRGANLIGADLSGADLRSADLRGANLRGANLSGADLRSADLRGADLSGADLSGANGLLDVCQYMAETFERVPDGYVVYKTFGHFKAPPDHWLIEAGSVLTEVCNHDRGTECGSGINVAPLSWVKRDGGGATLPIWRCLIRWEWLPGVVVPWGTDGKIRCSRVELLGLVEP